MDAPSDSLLAYRHAIAEEAIGRLQAAHPDQQIRLNLFACAGPQIISARGFCSNKPGPLRELEVFEGVVPSGSPRGLAGLGPVTELLVGEHIHISMESGVSGFLHLFNLGTNGDVARLSPPENEPPREIPAGRHLLITPHHGVSPFVAHRTPYRELGDSAGGCLGKANGYPERLLALVLKSPVLVEADDLHPEWRVFQHRYRNAGSPIHQEAPIGADEGEDLPQKLGNDWAWGCVAVPVVDASRDGTTAAGGGPRS